ncbi:MAG: DNA-binding protein [Thermoplasmata archaeon]
MKSFNKFGYLLFSVLVLFFIGLLNISYSQDQITASQAIQYIGQRKTVCGVIASVKYLRYSRGQPTFVNIDKPYPNQIFTLIVWGSDRMKFSNIDSIFTQGKKICATGLIKSYHGKPEMIIREPYQIN